MRLFGTDGVRGKANTELTPELAHALGRAAAHVLSDAGSPAMFILGRDTRVSGQMLGMALASGLMSAGANVWDAGILPTPALAYLTLETSAVAGVMISASHNPAIDNGIKFFCRDGFKLPDDVEQAIETALDYPHGLTRVAGDAVGLYTARPDLKGLYVSHLRGLAASFSGLTLVVDCAHGAGYEVARHLFDQMGATVHYIGCEPNGQNINVACGSTHLETLCGRVVDYGADVGLALDGDADRLIACDAKGSVVDGDSILAICGIHLKKNGKLRNNLAVGTVMSNYGLDALLKSEDIELLRTKVGDKYLLEEMRLKGAVIGAEQSGHCIFLEHGTTGDGLLTAIMLLNVMVAEGHSLSELNRRFERYPQVLISVPVSDRLVALEYAAVKEAIAQATAMITGKGRLLIRPSGTESLVRVMAEAEEEETARNVVMIVVDALRRISA